MPLTQSCGFSATLDDFFRGKACFGSGRIFVEFTAVAESACHASAITAAFEPEDLIVARGGNAFEWASVDTDHGRGCHQLAEGNVDLAGVPLSDFLRTHGSGKLLDHALQRSELIDGCLLGDGEAVDPLLDVRLRDTLFSG